MSRQVAAAIHRLGKEVAILTRSETGTDAFNNPESEWTDSGTTTRCVRTYPNRNTEVEAHGGGRTRDHPVFIFKHDKAPPADARIIYDGITYDLESPTTYDTHVAIFGQVVSS